MLNIQNRRYLGNKYKLLPFIENIIETYCKNTHSLFDVFAGTGVVAYHFADRMNIITSEILYSNYLSHIAFFGNEIIDKEKIYSITKELNQLSAQENNYMSETFSGTYFQESDCKKIGAIRERIDELYMMYIINTRERAILITSLLYAMDKIANTCGHYDSYRKGVKQKNRLFLQPVVIKETHKPTQSFLGDANELLRNKIIPPIDIAYLDPPYNSRNYSDLYHVLENVARWEKPQVFGEARKMNRDKIKSQYCTKQAESAFAELVPSLPCQYILLSYNNTGQKADIRSNAKISDEKILEVLSRKGSVEVFKQQHRAFTTGKSQNDKNEERIFFCKVKGEPK